MPLNTKALKRRAVHRRLASFPKCGRLWLIIATSQSRTNPFAVKEGVILVAQKVSAGLALKGPFVRSDTGASYVEHQEIPRSAQLEGESPQ
jgi:hypothetical protein